MAKNLLSKKAIKYIVQLRNDEDVRYSYTQIAKLVEENFGVKVCFQTIAYHYQRNKDMDTSSLSEVKPKSKLATLVEQRKAEKQAQELAQRPAQPATTQKPYRPSNSLLDENGEEPEWMKIANMSVPEFREYKAKKEAEWAAKEAEEEKQAQVTTPQSTPTHPLNQSHLPPSKRVYQAPDMEKLTRMLHMSDDEFREMMRQEAEEREKNTQTQK